MSASPIDAIQRAMVTARAAGASGVVGVIVDTETYADALEDYTQRYGNPPRDTFNSFTISTVNGPTRVVRAGADDKASS